MGLVQPRGAGRVRLEPGAALQRGTEGVLATMLPRHSGVLAFRRLRLWPCHTTFRYRLPMVAWQLAGSIAEVPLGVVEERDSCKIGMKHPQRSLGARQRDTGQGSAWGPGLCCTGRS